MKHTHETPPGAGSSGGGKGDSFARNEARLDNIERFMESTKDRLTKIDSRLDIIETRLETFATKEDLYIVKSDLLKEMNAQTWKFISFVTFICSALTAATFFIAKYVH